MPIVKERIRLKRFTTRLPETLHDLLGILSVEQNRSQNEIVIEAVERYVKRRYWSYKMTVPALDTEPSNSPSIGSDAC